MKRILCLISVCVLLMLSMVTASAENVSKFNLKRVSEDDTQAVLILDFDGGTPFSGLDFNVVVNEKKAKVASIVDGQGLINFKVQAEAAVSQSNVESTPAMVTAAMIPGYRNVDGSDLFKITITKLEKEKLTAGDVVIEITNCVDNNFQPIKASVTTELSAASEAEKLTDTSSTTDKTEAESSTDGSTADLTENTSEADTDEADTDKQETAENGTQDEKEAPNKTAVVIICVVAAVVVAGGAVAFVVIKKKKEG